MARDSISPQQEAWAKERAREERATRLAAVAFLVAIAASLSLFVVYVQGGQTQLEGTLLFVAFGGIGTGIGIWVKRIVGDEEIIEERYPERAAQADRAEFGAEFEASMGEAGTSGSRRFLLRLLGGAGASMGLALLIPLRSLGPGPKRELFTTSWAPGKRLATPEGDLLRPDDVLTDEIYTVFPEGAGTPADSQAVLVGLRKGLDRSFKDPDGVVNDLVCYSKICTHAGCPVGLYRAAEGELLCPCHQSTFDVYHGAAVLSGPTGRPLPQLPIGIDAEGYLVALGEFTEPVGPSFWNLTEDAGADRSGDR